MTDNTEPRLYGVSIGDGNNGVSHTFADYYVRTADPDLLVVAAAYDEYKPKAWDFLDSELEIAEEAEYTRTVWLYDEPDFELLPATCPSCMGSGFNVYDDAEPCPECEGSGVVPDEDDEIRPAAFILEVFPEDNPRESRPIYDSIEDALSAEAIARAKARD